MFAIGACTFGARGLKFGKELGFYPGEVIAYVRTGRTSPPGWRGPKSASGAWTVNFWENYIKQKLKTTPNLEGAGQVRSGPVPHPGVRQPVHVQGKVWCHGHWADRAETWPHGDMTTKMFGTNRTPTPWVGVAQEWFSRYVKPKPFIARKTS